MFRKGTALAVDNESASDSWGRATKTTARASALAVLEIQLCNYPFYKLGQLVSKTNENIINKINKINHAGGYFKKQKCRQLNKK